MQSSDYDQQQQRPLLSGVQQWVCEAEAPVTFRKNEWRRPLLYNREQTRELSFVNSSESPSSPPPATATATPFRTGTFPHSSVKTESGLIRIRSEDEEAMELTGNGEITPIPMLILVSIST